jgi:protein-tyrosine phosphatase
MSKPFTVLFVCVGNVCRSPLAERLLRARLDSTLGAEARELVAVESAGTRAPVGRPMDALAAAELERLGGDPDGSAARQFTEQVGQNADLVLTATKELRSRVLEDVPAALRRTFTIREFATLAEAASAVSPKTLVREAVGRRSDTHIEDHDLEDPIGLPADVHRRVAEAIDADIVVIAEALVATVTTDQVSRAGS